MAEKVKSYTLELTGTVKDFEEYCKSNNKIEKRELIKAIEHYLSDVVKYKKQQNPYNISDDDLPF